MLTQQCLPTALVPGPVSRLTYNVISESSVNISWSEPDETNGVIVVYSMRYGEFEGNADTDILVGSLHLTINGLSECDWILYSFNCIHDHPHIFVSSEVHSIQGHSLSKDLRWRR